MTNVGTVMIEQPRMARFHTTRPGWADSPCAPGSASSPCASVAACESPTTSTFTGLGADRCRSVRPPRSARAGRRRLGTTGGPPVCATSPTSPVSTGREPTVARTRRRPPRPRRRPWRSRASCGDRRAARRDGSARRRRSASPPRARRPPTSRTARSASTAEPEAGRREHEVERPVPQVHLVGDVADPSQRVASCSARPR